MKTYAQNFEDLMLLRCFKNKNNGFYIDVGANDPTIHSVTKIFYDKGWHGVNIEPCHSYFVKLKAERVKDINLECVVSSKEKVITFYEFEDTGLSTADLNVVARAEERGFTRKERSLQSTTLDTIIIQNNIQEIDFLKIDVEGFEKEVLLSFSFKIRPKIILVECTEIEQWEYLLKKQNYQLIYHDGLNNFYVPDEVFSEYKQYFLTPINIFDIGMNFYQEALTYEALIKNLQYENAKKNDELNRLRKKMPLQEGSDKHIEKRAKKKSFYPDKFPRKINLGCGYDYLENYLNVDMNSFHNPDLLCDITQLSLLPDEFYEQALAKDVLEHILRTECLSVLKEWNRILKKEGLLLVTTSNVNGLYELLQRPENQKIEAQLMLMQCLFGTQAYEGDFHFNSFTEITLRTTLRSAGFRVEEIKSKDVWLFEVIARKVVHFKSDEWDDFQKNDQFIKNIYWDILKRIPDEGGYWYYIEQLKNGNMQEIDVVNALECSEEKSER